MNLIIKTLLLSVFSFCKLSSFSQQGNNWYFGWFAGLTFNTSPPSALTDGALITEEGCSTISDKNGNLLFYTDGIKVFNRNHTVMPNGDSLMGSFSSTQSALIIPKPGDTSHYFIFTADAEEHYFAYGYRYSEIDMNLDGGLGDVTSTKNVSLYAPSTEKIAAVRHANGVDIWVLTKEYGNNRYKAFLVTCAGVNPNPVISDVGIVIQDPIGLSAIGQMKVSPDGKKIVAAIRIPEMVELFDFDNSTGMLSNAIDLSAFTPPEVQDIYGAEFSPNSNILYVTFATTNVIYQFDISSNDQTIIKASALEIPSPYSVNALQLGPDNKIYVGNYSWPFISVIDSPNNYGTSCTFLPAAISLNGKTSFHGLPEFISGYNYAINASNWAADFNPAFVGCSVEFNGSSNNSNTHWYWNFGDNTTDSGQLVRHSYRQPGSYNVTMRAFLTTTCGNIIDSIVVTKPVVVNNVLAVDFAYSGLCSNDPYQLTDNTILSVGNITGWDWDFGDGNSSPLANPVHIFNTPGAYNVKFVVSTNGICRADSITKIVYVDSKPAVDFSFNNGCVNNPLSFNDLSTNSLGNIVSWSWDFDDGSADNAQSPSHTYLNYGNYNITLTATSLHGCTSSASKAIVIDSKPVIDFSFNDGCINSPIAFNDLSTNNLGNIVSWSWDFNDGNVDNVQNSSHTFINYGNYNVTLTANSVHGCSTTSSKPLIVEDKPVADFIFDKQCPETPITLSDRSTSSLGTINIWQWSFGDNTTSNAQNPSHTYLQESNYMVNLIVSSVRGCVSDPKNIILKIRNITADAGPDALVVYNQPFQLNGSGGVSYLWSPANFLNNATISDPLATLTNDQVFNLKVTASDGCTGFDDVKITVVKKFDIYVPTAFTPNSDGRNDYLSPLCVGIKTLNYFTIYNRWGQVIFNTNNMNARWDGSFNGSSQPSATFVWIAKGVTIDGKVIERKGTLTLIR